MKVKPLLMRIKSIFEMFVEQSWLEIKFLWKKSLFVGYLHSIRCVNCAASQKNCQSLNFLCVLREKFSICTIFTMFLFIKSVWFELFQKFFLILIFVYSTLIFLQRFSFLHKKLIKEEPKSKWSFDKMLKWCNL